MTNRNKYYKVFLTLILTLTFFISRSSGAVIVGILKPQQRITFFYEGTKICRLENKSNRDTVIAINVNITIVTEFRYGVVYSKDNKLLHVRNTMLLSPNDSIVFAKEGNELVPINKDARSIFLNLHIQAGYYALDETANKEAGANFNEFSKNQQEKFEIDSVKINQLYEDRVISKEQKQLWAKFIKIHFIATLYKFSAKNPGTEATKKLDKLFPSALNYFEKDDINGDLIDLAASYLASYWVTNNKNKSSSVPLNAIDFYLHFQNRINSFYLRSFFISYIRNVANKNTTSFKDNFEKIHDYAKEHDHDFLEELDLLSKKRIFDLESVSLIDTNNVKSNLKEIIATTGKEYVLIDIWASWCVPCRQHIPYLEKIKKELYPKNIAFISISTDKLNQAWLNTKRPSGLNFRLPPLSILPKFFNVNSIPRYIILDKSGLVISDRFYTPPEEEFVPALLKIVDATVIIN